MKNFNYIMIFFLMIVSSNICSDKETKSYSNQLELGKSLGRYESPATQFFNNSLVNLMNEPITVEVVFAKNFTGRRLHNNSIADLIKYAADGDEVRLVKYTVEPKKTIKIFEKFLKSNPSNSKEYWAPISLTILKQDSISLTLNPSLNGLIAPVVKSQHYSVNTIDGDLQVKTEYMIKDK